MEKTIKKNRRSFLETLTGGILGLSFFLLTSHPKSPVNKNWPGRKIKSVHITPSIKYHRKDKMYHFHHWLILSSFYLPILVMRKNIVKSKLAHGFIIGGIIQGLLYKDRFKIINTLEEMAAREKVSAASE